MIRGLTGPRNSFLGNQVFVVVLAIFNDDKEAFFMFELWNKL